MSNSARDQQIKRKFVEEEVFANISDLADNLFDYDGERYASFYEFENWNNVECPYCGEMTDDFELTDYTDECGNEVYMCPNCDHLMSNKEYWNAKDNEPEIYEYYIVSSYLGKLLKDHGEIVLERMMGWIWGRQCTGQSIMLDNVIDEICEEREILEGQSYEWKV